MRHQTKRGRLAAITALCLLLIGLIGPAGALAAPAPVPASVHAANAGVIIIGAGSCIGSQACFGATGPIGDNSCDGIAACTSSSGSVGNISCNQTSACQNRNGNVGNQSCNGDSSCLAGAGKVGDHSCVGVSACANVVGNVGTYSCNLDGGCQNHVGDIGDCQANYQMPAPCVQPDGRIRRSGGPRYGNDVYNSTGDSQYVTMKVSADSFRRVYISIQNDGLLPVQYSVCQCGATIGDGVSVRYFRGRGNHELTSDVQAGTLLTPELAPGARYVIRARVAVSEAATLGDVSFIPVTATSLPGFGVIPDTVAIWVQRK